MTSGRREGMTGARSSTGAANGRASVRADLGVVIEVFAFCDREGAPAVSVRACDVFGAPLGDERADHVSAVLVAAGNAIGARRAREASEARARELEGLDADLVDAALVGDSLGVALADGAGDGGES